MSKDSKTTPPADAAADDQAQAKPEAPKAPEPPKPQTKAKPKAVPALSVRSVGETFCRGGRRWTREPQVVALSEFTEEQVASIKAEPLVFAVETTLEVEG